MPSPDTAARIAERKIKKIRPILAGVDPAIQSAVLADLLATWLAGHQMADRPTLEKYREELLANHIALVRELVPVNEAEIFEQHRKQ